MVECRDFFIMKSKVFSMLTSKCVTLGAKLLYIKKYSQSLAETKGKGYTMTFLLLGARERWKVEEAWYMKV